MIWSIIILNWFLSEKITESPPLVIRVENIRYSEGYIFVGIYESAESWEVRKPEREINFEKKDLIGGTLEVKLEGLKPGTYGFAVLDDANGNNSVDMGLIFPKEGFGFSNFQFYSYKLPKFEDFDFKYPESQFVVIKMRYLDF